MSTSFPDLRRFFAPRSVAFVGATEDLGKFGGRCVRLLMDFGYEGPVYPVNPKRADIFGRKCYPSVAELPETPDHVGIVLPAPAVPAVLEECARRKVPFATVFTSGFSEMGTPEGRQLQERLVDIARSGGTRFMGPNCNGMINFVDRFALTSTSAIKGPRRAPGDIGVVSQSGGAGQINVMWRAQQAGLGVSYQVSCGNNADLDLLDYMAFMVEDERTKVVLAIAERLDDGARLRALAQRAAQLDKPVVMVKVGRSEAGSRAAASHTGAVTGSDAVFDAAMRQLGILRVDDTSELYEAAMLLRRGRRAGGRRASATSVSGGNLVMVADLAAGANVEFPAYSEATQRKLGELLPGFGTAANPTDLTAMAIGRKDAFASVCRVMAGDPAIDTVIPVLTMSPAEEIRSVAGFSAACAKPVAILWTGGCIDEPALAPATLVAEGHAVYRDALPCLKAVGAAARYGEFRRRPSGSAVRPAGIDREGARALLQGRSGILVEADSKRLLKKYGLPVTREFVAKDAHEAARRAREIGGPVALKIQSAGIVHKTEAGAILLGLVEAADISAGFRSVMEAAHRFAPEARLDGVLVQEMVGEGVEMLMGVSQDPTFGPVLTLGLGGIHVEILQDVAVRLPPVSRGEILAMLRELRAWPLLEGARGRAPADIEALADCIERISWLAVDLGDRIRELDVNPLKVLSQGSGARVVDALAVLR